jgi:RecG-like helicase
VVLKVLSLSAALALIAAAPLVARQCKYREMQGVAGEKMTITAKIDAMEPDEDDPKTIWVTLDNSAADHCLTFLTGVPKAAVAKCKVGQQVTATGKVYERMDAWWGLNKVTGVSCK